MIKGLDYKLVNLVLISLLIYLIYETRSFWLGVVSILKEILLPFFIAFVLAYVLNTIISSLVKKKIPRTISILIVLITLFLAISIFSYILVPKVVGEITNMTKGIVDFVKDAYLKEELSGFFNDFTLKISGYLSNGMVNAIGLGINFISKFFIVIAGVIYFLIDMERIKEKVKTFFIKRNKRIYQYLSLLNKKLNLYFSGFLKIVIISFFEYFILYLLIGHPNALLLGFLASMGNLIPYFGGIITNIIAAFTAFIISPSLFIKTIIAFVIFSAIDGYIINPLVYGKTNKLHPLIIIVSVFAGGVLGGVMGIIFALPICIILITTYNFFRKDIKIRLKR